MVPASLIHSLWELQQYLQSPNPAPVSQVLLSLPEVPPELGALLQHLGLKPNNEKAPALL